MKNKNLRHHYESAKIYKQYYKPSFSPVRLLRSLFAVFFSGSAIVAHHPKKK